MHLKSRLKNQGFTDYEVLETHECKYTASNREIELQKEYGYPVDKTPYFKLLEVDRSIGGRKGGLSNVRSGHWSSLKTREHQQKAGKAGHKVCLEKGIYKEIGKKKRKLLFTDAEEIRRLCKTGISQRKVAKQYNVTQRTIGMIVNYVTYKEP